MSSYEPPILIERALQALARDRSLKTLPTATQRHLLLYAAVADEMLDDIEKFLSAAIVAGAVILPEALQAFIHDNRMNALSVTDFAPPQPEGPPKP